jgi:hypothetical protein
MAERSRYESSLKYTEMRKTLLAFKLERRHAAPTQHKAFFAALRAALSDAMIISDVHKQAATLNSTFQWFCKHLPSSR